MDWEENGYESKAFDTKDGLYYLRVKERQNGKFDWAVKDLNNRHKVIIHGRENDRSTAKWEAEGWLVKLKERLNTKSALGQSQSSGTSETSMGSETAPSVSTTEKPSM